MTQARGPILVYNPISGHGHLDAWNALVISFLLERGERVLALTPGVAELMQRLDVYKTPNRTLLSILTWDIPKKSFATRAFARLKALLGPHTWQKKYATLHDPEDQYLEPFEMAERIGLALKGVTVKPVFMFNMYMDLYRTDAARWLAFDQSFNLPWAGIRFIPSESSTEAYYDTKCLRGMCLLDESVAQRYQQARPSLTFRTLPDVIDASTAAADSSVVKHIRDAAKGRTIVFMGGTIGKSKNLVKWYELIRSAEASQWYFVQIGEVLADSLSPEDRRALQDIDQDPPENLFRHTHYLPDERDFNAVIQAADIIFAVYRDFRISSNMLGKAATFKKPIVVADNYLMGERVRRYQLGFTAAQDDVMAMLKSLKLCIDNPPHMSSFQAYAQDFSQTAFKESLFGFLEDCMS